MSDFCVNSLASSRFRMFLTPTSTGYTDLESERTGDFYLDETLADVAGTERLVAAGGQSQPRQEKEESCGGSGGGEGRLTGPHPDSSPAPYWKLLEHQHGDREEVREQTWPSCCSYSSSSSPTQRVLHRSTKKKEHIFFSILPFLQILYICIIISITSWGHFK